MIAADKIIRKHAVKLGDTRLCMLPLRNVCAVIGNITKTKNILYFLFFLIGNYPIVKDTIIVCSSLYIVFYKILCISDNSE